MNRRVLSARDSLHSKLCKHGSAQPSAACGAFPISSRYVGLASIIGIYSASNTIKGVTLVLEEPVILAYDVFELLLSVPPSLAIPEGAEQRKEDPYESLARQEHAIAKF
jgi:hypothetical protein